MKLLAMDSACAACSVALMENDQVLANTFEEMARGQAERLVPMVQEVLARGAVDALDLDAIAVTTGPGAFTGLRIALASARAMGLAIGVPVVGVTTLEVLCAEVLGRGEALPEGVVLLAALDAKRADVYVQVFDRAGKALGAADALLPENVISLLAGATQVLIAGDAYDRLAPVLQEQGIATRPSQVCLPDALWVARVALSQPIAKDLAPPAPFYIRPPDAAIPKDGGKLRP